MKLYSSAFIFPLSIIFQALNLILLTSSELSEIRDLLKQSLVTPAGKDLYDSLYASWCHSPMAIISLCFLAQVGLYNEILIIFCHSKFLSFCSKCTSASHTHCNQFLFVDTSVCNIWITQLLFSKIKFVFLNRLTNMPVLWFSHSWSRILMSNFWSNWIDWSAWWKLQSLPIFDCRCIIKTCFCIFFIFLFL